MESDIPISLGGLFEQQSEGEEDDEFAHSFDICNKSIQVYQSSFHPLNANGVWPATFLLGNYLLDHVSNSETILEIGSTTGALAIALSLSGLNRLQID